MLITYSLPSFFPFSPLDGMLKIHLDNITIEFTSSLPTTSFKKLPCRINQGHVLFLLSSFVLLFFPTIVAIKIHSMKTTRNCSFVINWVHTIFKLLIFVLIEPFKKESTILEAGEMECVPVVDVFWTSLGFSFLLSYSDTQLLHSSRQPCRKNGKKKNGKK